MTFRQRYYVSNNIDAGKKSKTQNYSMHVIKRLMVNYDTPRQYLDFVRTDF